MRSLDELKEWAEEVGAPLGSEFDRLSDSDVTAALLELVVSVDASDPEAVDAAFANFTPEFVEQVAALDPPRIESEDQDLAHAKVSARLRVQRLGLTGHLRPGSAAAALYQRLWQAKRGHLRAYGLTHARRPARVASRRRRSAGRRPQRARAPDRPGSGPRIGRGRRPLRRPAETSNSAAGSVAA